MAVVKRSSSRRTVFSSISQNSKLKWALLATAPVAAALWGNSAFAQTATWDASGANPAAPTDGGGSWDTTTSANWSSGGVDAVWTNGSVAQIGTANGSAGTINIDDASGSITAGGININPATSGNYTIGAIGTDSLVLTGTSTVPAAITVAPGLSPTISAPIAGSNGLTLGGTGTLNLSATNTYFGNTVLNSGTLNLNTGGTLGDPSAGVVMGIIGAQPGGATAPLTTVSTMNLNTGVTIGSLTVNTNSTSSNAITIAGSQTLAVSGAVAFTLNPKLLAGTYTIDTVISGLGAFTVGGASNNASFQVGTGETDSANAAGQTHATLDMSGLPSFSFTTGTGEFDVGNGSHGQGNVLLAKTSNQITAATVRVGDSTDGTASGNAGAASTLQLGAGSNVIAANTVTIGAVKDTATLNFQTTTGSLTITNEAGTGGAALNVGVGSSGSSSANGTANFAGHLVTLTLAGLDIGHRTGSSTGTNNVGGIGSLTFDDGTISCTALNLGHASGASSTTGFARGTLTVGGSNVNTATLNGPGANLGQSTSGGTGTTTTGILNVLQNGIVNFTGNISIAVGASDVGNATVTIGGGLLNMGSNNIGGAAPNVITLVTTSGELQNVGTINSTGGITMATAGNNFILDGNNAYTGGTSITAGTIQVGTASDTVALTQPLGTAAGAVTNSSVLNFASNQATTVNNQITGTGVVNLNAAGAVTLSASNSYQGATTVNAGSLVVTNTSGSATGTGNVTMNAGILASGPVGNISGNVLAGTGTHTIAPGGVGTIGTLTIGGLTSSSLTTLNFDLGTDVVTQITTGDVLTLGSGTVSIASGTMMTFGGTPITGDNYRLIGDMSGGTVVGAIPLANFSLPSAPAGQTFALSTSVDAGFIDLVVGSSGPANLTWNNNGGDNLWNSASPNWNNGSGNTTYTDGAKVTFDDNNPSTTGPNYNVTLNTTVSPGSVTLSNNANNYVISGTGHIAGTGTLTRSGVGTATLDTVNTYTGGTDVFQGTLIAGVSGAIPNAPVTIEFGTLQLAPSTGATTITSLAINGNGTLDITNNHVVIDYGAPANDPVSSIAVLLKTGYNNGAWNGVGGITSSAIAANPGYTIGYADAADAGNPAGLASGTMEIAFTLIGDADLNHTVNGIDFGILAANFNKTVSRWDQGDFDYNGIVNGIDFTALAANFNKAASNASDLAALEAFAAANGLLADVPEPATLGLLAVGACGLMARRRRRTS
jgi:autotransporter-associated beta strand protein